MADFYPILDHLHQHIELLQKKVDEGYSIMIFPEGTRSETGKIGRFHKGAFYLAEQLKLDILPIILHGPGDCITKGEPYLKNGRIDMHIEERIPLNDSRFGEGYVARSKAFRKWYQEQYQQIQANVVDPDYMRKRVELNYIYKGPVLEWYGKIKMNFEKNYQFFHEHIPSNAKIIDLGCGNGFMDYMLLFLSPERQIIGVDYDEEKILVAQNCNGYHQYKENSIRFEAADLMQWEYQMADVYIIMDTLHYLPQEEQEYVIKQAIKHLKPKGKIIIRDADTDLDKKHRGTKFSEWQSTKVFGFNKTKDASKQLYFSSAKLIQELLKSQGLQVITVDETKMNSNIIIIGKKQ
jgi:2-polyprenyl-3-methyl-5-hydroxy-6-metoxy-1,4-benzoquinol methylase